jgi:hypothetical protein
MAILMKTGQLPGSEAKNGPKNFPEAAELEPYYFLVMLS